MGQPHFHGQMFSRAEVIREESWLMRREKGVSPRPVNGDRKCFPDHRSVTFLGKSYRAQVVSRKRSMPLC